jgi:SAM-dependent methyltransferase
MKNYYGDHLSADRLRRVYELAPPRIVQYLEAEIDFLEKCLHHSDIILELGCGYGRVLKRICTGIRYVIGIDTSAMSLRSAAQDLNSLPNVALAQMDATRLGFYDEIFDSVICIQNGISAFHVDPFELVFQLCGRLLGESAGLVSDSSGEWIDRRN